MSIVSNTMVKIRIAYYVMSGKHVDVSLTYRGNELGSKPWLARCDSYEYTADTDEKSVAYLYDMITGELEKKAASTEQQAKQLRQAINSLKD